MSSLEKIQKGMRVFQILSKIVLVFAVVGVVLTSIAAVLAAADVLNMENQFLHFLSVSAEMSKGQLVGILSAADISLLLGGIITLFVYRYFTAELKRRDAVYKCRRRPGKAAWNYHDCIICHICECYRLYLREDSLVVMEYV